MYIINKKYNNYNEVIYFEKFVTTTKQMYLKRQTSFTTELNNLVVLPRSISFK